MTFGVCKPNQHGRKLGIAVNHMSLAIDLTWLFLSQPLYLFSSQISVTGPADIPSAIAPPSHHLFFGCNWLYSAYSWACVQVISGGTWGGMYGVRSNLVQPQARQVPCLLSSGLFHFPVHPVWFTALANTECNLFTCSQSKKNRCTPSDSIQLGSQIPSLASHIILWECQELPDCRALLGMTQNVPPLKQKPKP